MRLPQVCEDLLKTTTFPIVCPPSPITQFPSSVHNHAYRPSSIAKPAGERDAVDVKRPRLNPRLDPNSVGVVEIAAGGMHCIALTHDNKILTWGVNDQGTLGRDTTWDGGLKDMDAMNDDDATSPIIHTTPLIAHHPSPILHHPSSIFHEILCKSHQEAQRQQQQQQQSSCREFQQTIAMSRAGVVEIAAGEESALVTAKKTPSK